MAHQPLEQEMEVAWAVATVQAMAAASVQVSALAMAAVSVATSVQVLAPPSDMLALRAHHSYFVREKKIHTTNQNKTKGVMNGIILERTKERYPHVDEAPATHVPEFVVVAHQ